MERLPLRDTLPVRVPLLQKLLLSELVEDTECEGVRVTEREPLEQRVGEREEEGVREIDSVRDAVLQAD